jgi:hypothetical protein
MVEVLNSGLRFMLEIAGLISTGYWGYQRTDGSPRWLLMLVPPLVIATIWAVFRVPGDGGEPTVIIPGLLRLAFELSVFGAAVLALNAAGLRTYAIVLVVVVLGHYAVDWERAHWLVQQ